MNQAILLVDASHLARTFFHWGKGKSDGISNTTADMAERFSTRLDRLRQQLDHKFDDLLCFAIFDNNRKTFRHRIAEDYKAGRKVEPDWPECRDHCKDVVQHMDGWGFVQAPYLLESDDLIAAVAYQSRHKVIIHGADKDFNQCLESGRVSILKSSKVDEQDFGRLDFKWLTEDMLHAEFGFGPDRWIDYQCMVGDSADNIKGADGVGPKMATKLIQAYSRIQDVNPDELNSRQAASWGDFLERLPMIRNLITLDRTAELPSRLSVFCA